MTTKAWHSLAAAICTAAITTSTLAADNLFSTALTGPAPTINGQKGAVEWTGAPNLSLRTPTYPIDTDVYFRHSNTHLYVLVDAIGDTTDDNHDECLLVFGLPPSVKIVEMWRDDSFTPSVVRGNGSTAADSYYMGMSGGNRVYEFAIPLSNLNLQPGQSIEFYSPISLKQGYVHYASMPYDANTTRDNVYPTGLSVSSSGGTITSVTGYSTVQLATTQPGSPTTVPTLNAWGLALLSAIIAGGGAILTRRRRNPS